MPLPLSSLVPLRFEELQPGPGLSGEPTFFATAVDLESVCDPNTSIDLSGQKSLIHSL